MVFREGENVRQRNISVRIWTTYFGTFWMILVTPLTSINPNKIVGNNSGLLLIKNS
jgi:hypothetical protein